MTMKEGGGVGVFMEVGVLWASIILIFSATALSSGSESQWKGLNHEECQRKWERCVKAMHSFAGVNSTCDGIIYGKWNCSRISSQSGMDPFNLTISWERGQLANKGKIGGRGFVGSRGQETTASPAIVGQAEEQTPAPGRSMKRPSWLPDGWNVTKGGFDVVSSRGTTGGTTVGSVSSVQAVSTTPPRQHLHNHHHENLHHEPLVPVADYVEEEGRVGTTGVLLPTTTTPISGGSPLTTTPTPASLVTVLRETTQQSSSTTTASPVAAAAGNEPVEPIPEELEPLPPVKELPPLRIVHHQPNYRPIKYNDSEEQGFGDGGGGDGFMELGSGSGNGPDGNVKFAVLEVPED